MDDLLDKTQYDVQVLSSEWVVKGWGPWELWRKRERFMVYFELPFGERNLEISLTNDTPSRDYRFDFIVQKRYFHAMSNGYRYRPIWWRQARFR